MARIPDIIRHRTTTAGAWRPAALFIAGLLVFIDPAAAAAQQATATVRGRVVTPVGQPAAGAEIRVVGLGRHVDADVDGRFRIEVPAGSYVLEVYSARFGRAVERIAAEAGADLDLAIRLEPVFHAEPIIASVGPEARTQTELYQATDVLVGRELVEKGRNSIGETLAEQPGVTSTYYGPGSSRPVIRGLQGDRVRVLESGVSSGDVSASGPDHAVAVEPMLAGQIEIIRGPSTLLYGSSAIGGAVNMIDPRIPREKSIHALTGHAQVQGATVSDELNGGASLNGTVGSFGWHASGLLRNTDDYRIPGPAVAPLAQEPGEDHPDLGFLLNSALETRTGSLGASWVGSAGYLGAAVTGYGTKYGVPGHEHDEEELPPAPGEEHEPGVRIDLDQTRFDVEGAWNFGGNLVRAAKLRAGYSDYRHRELEGDEVGTQFDNSEFEGRLEATHAPLGPVSGTLGAQYGNREVLAEGLEAFLPDTRTRSLALFLYEEIPIDGFKFGVGARWEGNDHDVIDGRSQSSDGFSGSLGVNWSASESVTLTAAAARSTKLPSAEELFSDGPHAATRLYEVGDPDLVNEIGHSVDAALIVTEGPVTGQVAGYLNSFDDFIFITPTDSTVGGFVVAEYGQADARFYGFELNLKVAILHRPGNHLALTGFSDYVRAEATDADEPLPFIPPLRWGGGALWEVDRWRAALDVRRTAEQTRVADFETPTPGYTFLNASVSYAFFTGKLIHEVTLRGTNLTDQEARNHVSLLKDIAPLPGRDIRLTYRLMF
ncbi:MAG: TonB-dependent receptor [Gemmatimonadetes bacterium]|nr:TonB-dependent receptor [Gemmatimonadota bacterium]